MQHLQIPHAVFESLQQHCYYSIAGNPRLNSLLSSFYQPCATAAFIKDTGFGGQCCKRNTSEYSFNVSLYCNIVSNDANIYQVFTGQARWIWIVGSSIITEANWGRNTLDKQYLAWGGVKFLCVSQSSWRVMYSMSPDMLDTVYTVEIIEKVQYLHWTFDFRCLTQYQNLVSYFFVKL